MNQITLPNSRSRIYSLDILRGIVMIIMALDHTRDFFHFDAFVHDPLDLATTSPWLFFTRWVTHFCAPAFVFLAGTSAFLQSGKKSKKELSLFLIKRGLWLIFIEVTVITFAWSFDVGYHLLALQVIWAIGFSMVMLGLLIWLPLTAIFIIGAAITLGHDLLDNTVIMQSKDSGALFDLLFKGNFAHYQYAPGHSAMMIYAGIPWLGVMMLGYCFGTIYQSDFGEKRRRRLLNIMGLGLLLLFVSLRSFNIYGDPHHWSGEKNVLFSFLSFINLTKYPPSLLYLCITIGPALLFLANFENVNNKFTQAVSVFGRVPFFYYVLHLYLLHGIEVVTYFWRGHSFAEGVASNGKNVFLFSKPGEGFPLWGVYVVWILVVLALYPLCKWFNDYKNRHRVWWMSYL